VPKKERPSKKKKAKIKQKKPTASMLGTGTASKAAKAIKKRKEQLKKI